MSRNQGDFAEVGNERLEESELLALIRGQGTLPVRDLQQAIACYLSSGEAGTRPQVLRGNSPAMRPSLWDQTNLPRISMKLTTALQNIFNGPVLSPLATTMIEQV